MTRGQARHEYDPPTDRDAPGVCVSCANTLEARYAPAPWFPIQNSRTGIYHSGGEYGITDCGRDATADHWRWPV